MPEHPHHIRSEAYKYRFDLLFASLLCTIVVNIFFPEDIYDGIAQTIYLPIQLIAGITLFDIRRKGYLLPLLIFLGGLLIVGRLLDSFTPLNLREYLVFAYVVFFGWVTLELFRQIYTAPLVDRESVLAALGAAGRKKQNRINLSNTWLCRHFVQLRIAKVKRGQRFQRFST